MDDPWKRYAEAVEERNRAYARQMRFERRDRLFHLCIRLGLAVAIAAFIWFYAG